MVQRFRGSTRRLIPSIGWVEWHCGVVDHVKMTTSHHRYDVLTCTLLSRSSSMPNFRMTFLIIYFPSIRKQNHRIRRCLVSCTFKLVVANLRYADIPGCTSKIVLTSLPRNKTLKVSVYQILSVHDPKRHNFHWMSSI